MIPKVRMGFLIVAMIVSSFIIGILVDI